MTIGAGSRERFQRLREHPRARWVDFVPFERLPSFLKRIDVGLTPYCDSAFNRASFPLKTLEYLAAGKPVVSTDLPAARSLDTELLTVAGRSEFGCVVKKVALESSSIDLAAKRIAFAEQHSWRARAASFAAAIGIAEGPG